MQPHADLLALACHRLARTGVPACIKDSELRYVAVSRAFADLYRLDAQAFQGLTDAELPNGWPDARRDELERRAIVFAQEGAADISLGAAGIAHRFAVEQFVTDNGDIFLFERCDEIAEEAPPRVKPIEQPKRHQKDEGAFLSLIESAMAEFDAGILIVNGDDVVVYVNETLRRLHRRFMGTIQVGENLAEALARGAGNGIVPGLDVTDDAARRAWVESRLKGYRVPYFEDLFKTSDNRLVQMINRRLPNGYMVALHLDVTESREREALMKRQTEEVNLYKAILDALPVPVFVRDENHIMTYANEVELNLQDTIGASTLGTDERAIFGDEAQAYYEENERVLQTGVTTERETFRRNRDGGETPIVCRVSRAVLPDGKRYVIGSLSDITVLKERERDLEAARGAAESARQQLLDIMNSIDTGVIVVRQDDLTIELANEDVLRKWKGTPLEGLVGHRFTEMLEYNDNVGRFAGSGVNLETAIRKWTEQIRSGNVPEREVASDEGDVLLIQGRQIGGGLLVLTYKDITELRRQDKAINEARSALAETGVLMNEALTSMAQGLMFIIDERIRIMNCSVKQLLDLPDDLLKVGDRWSVLFDYCAERGDFADDPAGFIGSLSQDVRRGGTVDRTVCIGQRWIRVEAKLMGEKGAIVLLTDITEMRSRQETLEALLQRAARADRAKSDFLATVSHEIRTPMNGVLSMAELLARSELNTRQKTYVNAIAKSSKALMTVINDILDFSKLDSGELQLQSVSFNPVESVDDVASLFASKAEEKGIELIVSPAAGLPARVHGDALRFRQIVFNLVNNAIRFTEAGHVEVRLDCLRAGEGGPALKVEIEDTGCGMAPEQLEGIFEKFARVATPVQRFGGGLGLGLATTDGLVKLFGGAVDVKSELEVGSTFSVVLPIQFEEQRGRNDTQLPGEMARVLVVVESEPCRQSIVAMLRGWNVDATGVDNVEDAIAVLAAADDAGIAINALVVSHSLPKRGARRLADFVRGDARFADVPVILLTSVFPESLHGAADIAAHAQLQKPVRSSLLFDALCEVLAGRRRAAAPAAHAPAATAPEKIDILVAEDNEVNILVYREILSALGCNYALAKDGAQAIDMWRRLNPDIVLMDITMPNVDGFEATAAIRDLERKEEVARTPIIGVTAHTFEHDREACLEAGMDDYLPKPISPEMLIGKIDAWRAIVAGQAAISRDFIQSA